jgi:hypothetical protein
MPDPQTLADQTGPIALLALLATGSHTLPALNIAIDTIEPNELHLSVHHKPSTFDAWLAALAPTGTEVTTLPLGPNTMRKARFKYAGADIELIDYVAEGGAA